MNRIAYFISPHGFGHAARAASVMEAMCTMDLSIRHDIFTTIAPWFFEGNLNGWFNYHYLLTDLGLAQITPFEADLDKTLQGLNQLLPYDASQVAEISQRLLTTKCKMVICDIAPIGLLIAKAAGIPSVLVENFTWDWIYERYAARNQQIIAHIDYLRRLFEMADIHIQTKPVCNPKSVDLLAGPASRKIRSSKIKVREKLCVPSDHKLVLITTGGVPLEYKFVEKLKDQQRIHFVIPGNRPAVEFRDNLTLLPHHSDFFHPDLVNSSDAVIGKAGYSTIAEIYHAGVPFGYIEGPLSREAEKLVEFIKCEMAGSAIGESEFQNGNWVSELQTLLAMPHIKRNVVNGADQIAKFILNALK